MTTHLSSSCTSIVATMGVGSQAEATTFEVVGLLAVGLVTGLLMKCTVFIPTEVPW